MSTNPQDKSDVQAMFGRIAPRYDLMNRLMTFGRDQAWRRFVVDKAQLSNDSTVLDIASGTGDIAFAIRETYPSAKIVAADFALPMMFVGQKRPMGSKVDWLGADAQKLPLPSAEFDATVSGFLFRNVPDIDLALAEQFRVLRSGGRLVTLDTTPPANPLLKPFINIHLKLIIPVVGKMITGDSIAYSYLPESTLAFKSAETLAERIEQAGFKDAGFKKFMMGTVAVHWGTKP